MQIMHFKSDQSKDFTYSSGCGCQVTFFANSEYHTSRMLPGEKCQIHTAAHQHAERDSFVADGRAALSEYRHQTEAVRRYLQTKQSADGILCCIVDGEYSSGFMPMRQALKQAAFRLGRVSLPVWDCDARNWDSELITDADC